MTLVHRWWQQDKMQFVPFGLFKHERNDNPFVGHPLIVTGARLAWT